MLFYYQETLAACMVLALCYDKLMALLGGWRLSETFFVTLSFLGGFPGLPIGMLLFRCCDGSVYVMRYNFSSLLQAQDQKTAILGHILNFFIHVVYFYSRGCYCCIWLCVSYDAGLACCLSIRTCSDSRFTRLLSSLLLLEKAMQTGVMFVVNRWCSLDITTPYHLHLPSSFLPRDTSAFPL